jgi:hypothetical protein
MNEDAYAHSTTPGHLIYNVLGYNQLEFFALSPMTEEGGCSPRNERVVVTGCKIMNDGE